MASPPLYRVLSGTTIAGGLQAEQRDDPLGRVGTPDGNSVSRLDLGGDEPEPGTAGLGPELREREAEVAVDHGVIVAVALGGGLGPCRRSSPTRGRRGSPSRSCPSCCA